MDEVFQEVIEAPTKTGLYTLEEAIEAATKYFDGDDLAGKVWATKYA